MEREVETAYGRLRGRERGAHLAFLGVPYARPPVRDLRFKAPQPPAAWSSGRINSSIMIRASDSPV